MTRSLISIFAAMVLVASSAAQADPGRPVTITPMGQTIAGTRMPFATDCGIWDQLRLVVRDREIWSDVWKRIHSFGPAYSIPQPPPPLPDIDFSREMVVVAAMGRRPSSAYSIVIEGAYAYERNYRLEIVVRSKENRKGCAAWTVMTAPIDIVRMPKTDRAVLFRETEDVPDCR